MPKPNSFSTLFFVALPLFAGCGESKQTTSPEEGKASPGKAAARPAEKTGDKAAAADAAKPEAADAGAEASAEKAAPEEDPEPPPEVSDEVREKCAVFDPPWGDTWWVTWGRENPEEGEEWMDTIEETMSKADLSVLPECVHLTHIFLGFTEIEDLTPIEGLEHLRYVDLRFATKLKDLSPLTELPRLKHLVITGTGVTDLSEVGKIDTLEELEARMLLVRSAEPLAGMPNLWRVDLLKDPISDMSPLARIPKIRKVKLCQTDIKGYEDLFPVAEQLRGLETCNSKIPTENFSQLSRFENLTFLRLWGNSIDDLTPLTGMKDLEELDLTQTKVKDLTPLHGLKNLETFYLIMVDIEDEQIEKLKKAVPGVNVIRKMTFN